MTGGLFDDLDAPLELRQEAAPPTQPRRPLRHYPVFVPDERPGARRGWNQVDEVFGVDLADAGAVAALVAAWGRPTWTWPAPGVLVGARGRDRFAVIDPSVATAEDLPTA